MAPPPLRACHAFLAAAFLAALLGAPASRAAELDGSIQVSTGTVEDGTDTEVVEQQYDFTLFQQLTPYLTVRLGHRLYDFASEDAGVDLDRRSREPRVELFYNRRQVSAAVSWLDRVAEGTAEADRLETESLLGRLTWRPSFGPTVALRFRDETNVTDVAVVGRETRNRSLGTDLLYGRRFWSAGYSFDRSELANRLSGLALDQDRHDLRLQAFRPFLDDRLSVGFDGLASRVERTTRLPAGAEIDEPVPARLGLFAVDPSPEVGELAPAPGLVDGDTATAVPGIDVGGANTFRNLGVDLGVSRPVSALEVTVDRPSDAAVSWRVYRSADNLLWEAVGGVITRFEGDLLRYVLRFPETADRFFKAVNVTANAAVGVGVTEVRALREVGAGGAGTSEANLYRADVSAAFQPNDRFRLRLAAGGSDDEDLVGALTRSRREERHAEGRLTLGLVDDLRLHAGWGWVDFEEGGGPTFARTETRWSAGLVWTPLPTLDATLQAIQREEEDEGALVRATSTAQLRVTSELLPGLRLVSLAERSELDDGLGGLDRVVTSYGQTLDTDPWPGWTVGGGWTRRNVETPAGEPLLEETSLRLHSTWSATPWLSLVGTWDISRFDDRESLDHSYTVSYSPGDRLGLSATWQSFEDVGLRSTSSTAASMNYRVNARFTLFATWARSDFEAGDAQGTEVTSARAGFNLFF